MHLHGKSSPLTPASHSSGSKVPASPTHPLTSLPRGTPLVGPGTIPTIQARSHTQIHRVTLGTEPPFRAADPPRPSHMANASESIVRISSLCTERCVPNVAYQTPGSPLQSMGPGVFDRRGWLLGTGNLLVGGYGLAGQKLGMMVAGNGKALLRAGGPLVFVLCVDKGWEGEQRKWSRGVRLK
jgi:hypothetical protein